MTTDVGPRIFMSPATAPTALHIGTVRSMVIADALARAHSATGGRGLRAEAWNLAGRKFEASYSASELAIDEFIERAVRSGRDSTGIWKMMPTPLPPLRSDDPRVLEALQSQVTDLAELGRIRHLALQQHRCGSCDLILPRSEHRVCFRCGGYLLTDMTPAWYLHIDRHEIMGRVDEWTWSSTSARSRFLALNDGYTWLRVSHPGLTLGPTSPLDPSERLDARLVAAGYPLVLTRLGVDAPITLISGIDILRKFHLTLWAMTTDQSPVDRVLAHGLVLTQGRKVSRRAGAAPPRIEDPIESAAMRCALLIAHETRDVNETSLKVLEARKLVIKLVHVDRYLRSHCLPGKVDVGKITSEQRLRVQKEIRDAKPDRLFTALSALATHISRNVINQCREYGGHNKGEVLAVIASSMQILTGTTPETVGPGVVSS
jgi:hypothetical protein